MSNNILLHKHLIIRAEVNKPPLLVSYLETWLKNFIESIKMKLFMGPFVKYCSMPGNRGVTAVAIIETSHIAMHVWDEVSPALMQFDVYSCSNIDPKEICNKIKKDFDIVKIEYKFLDREKNLRDIAGGTFKPLSNYNEKMKTKKEKILFKSRKEVDINGNGTTGYTIKEGPQKGRVLKHIIIPSKNT